MKFNLIVIIGLGIPAMCVGQKTDNTPCKALCKVDQVMETVEKLHYIFTGSDTTGLDLAMTKITIMEGRKEMVKRRKDKNCDSPNPDDCLIEVMEEIPPITMNLYTLNKPDQTKEFDIRKEKISVVKSDAKMVEESVVCPKNISPSLIQKIQKALSINGFDIVENATVGVMDNLTKSAIIAFQKEKGIPYGELSLSTLAALDIK